MSDKTRKMVFVRNPEDGEPWALCGEYAGERAYYKGSQLKMAIGELVNGEIENMLTFGEREAITIEIDVRDMTDAEVDALPEI